MNDNIGVLNGNASSFRTNWGSVSLVHCNGTILVHWKSGERHLEGFIVQHHTGSTPNVMVWESMHVHSHQLHITSIITCQWYIFDILASELRPFLQMILGIIFQHDNALPHAACNFQHVPALVTSHDVPAFTLTRFVVNRKHGISWDSWLMWPHHLSPQTNRGCILKHSGKTFCRWPSKICFSTYPAIYSPSSLFMVGSHVLISWSYSALIGLWL